MFAIALHYIYSNIKNITVFITNGTHSTEYLFLKEAVELFVIKYPAEQILGRTFIVRTGKSLHSRVVCELKWLLSF